MSRLSYMEIAGKKYPLSFSLGACKAIAKKFGSIEKMGEVLTKTGEIKEKEIDDIIYVISVLIGQGCAYKNVFEKDFPIEEDAPVEDGKYIPLKPEEIEVAIALMDIGEVTRAITSCMSRSQKTEIETEQVKEKNADAPEED